MGALSIAFASNRRSGFPPAVALNVLSERSPTKPSQVDALIGRAGLAAFEQIGEAPIRGVFARAGLLDNRALIVAKNTAYLVSAGGVVTTLTGTIAGDGLVEIDGGLDADGNSLIRVANGSALYAYVSSGTAVVDEDRPAASVAFWNGYWLYTEAGTDYTYYQVPASSAWTALEFAAAEYRPDLLKGVRVVGDMAALMGSASFEMWYLTGDSSDPMRPQGGLKFDVGCRNIASSVTIRGSLIWVADDNTVRLSEGGQPQIISDNGLAEQIRNTATADLSATIFEQDGHVCYVLHLGTASTWVYDLTSQRWSNFSSLGYGYWRPRLIANLGEAVICADRNSNQTWLLDPDLGTDDGAALPREFYAFVDVPEGSVGLSNLVLDAHLGDAPTSDPDDESIMVMQISRDDGASWSSPRERGLGVRGARTVKPRWNGLGLVRSPGGIVKFACSGPGRFRVSAVRANVAA